MDLPAHFVLRLLEVLPLLGSETSVVFGFVRRFPIFNGSFAVLKMSCLASSHLIVPDAVGNAILLVLLTLVHVVLPTMACLGLAGPRIEGSWVGGRRRHLVAPRLRKGRTHKHQTSKGNGRHKTGNSVFHVNFNLLFGDYPARLMKPESAR
jgi:hypothetical protein